MTTRIATPPPVMLEPYDAPTRDEHEAVVDDLTKLRMEYAEHRTDIVGVSGTNGKIGTLRSRVDSLEADRKERAAISRWAIGVSLPVLIAIVAAYLSLRDQQTETRAELRHVNEAIQILMTKVNK